MRDIFRLLMMVRNPRGAAIGMLRRALMRTIRRRR